MSLSWYPFTQPMIRMTEKTGRVWLFHGVVGGLGGAKTRPVGVLLSLLRRGQCRVQILTHLIGNDDTHPVQLRHFSGQHVGVVAVLVPRDDVGVIRDVPEVD